MQAFLNKRAQARLVALVAVAGFVLTPLAEAAREGRGGGGGGGGNRAAPSQTGGGGANRAPAQANNTKADSRSNNVRSTSVNNVNTNRNTNVNASRNTNVNVNVEGNNNCCGGGWDDDYHPVATAAAITATVAVTSAVIGSMVRTVPANCVPVNYAGMVYQQCGSTWYQPQGSQFIVVNPPY
jgi:hypothetical protein